MPSDANIQTTLRELPLDKLEKLGEMLAELKNGSAEDKIKQPFMFEDNKKRQRIVARLSLITVVLSFAWGVTGFYIFQTSSSFPDNATGKTTRITYKSSDRYITLTQYWLFLGLPLAGFLSIPFIILITSPKIGIFRYDTDEKD